MTYLGATHFIFGVGFILGALLGYLVGVAVQRWRNVRELRGIQRRVAQAAEAGLPPSGVLRIGEEWITMEGADPATGLPTGVKRIHYGKTELRRRKL